MNRLNSSINFFLMLLNLFACVSQAAVVTVDKGAEQASGIFGRNNDLVLDSMGYPVIAFVDTNFLYLIHCNDIACSGGDDLANRLVPVTGGNPTPSLNLNSAGNPVMTFYDGDFSRRDLLLIRCNNSDCSNTSSVDTIVNNGDSGAFSSLILDASDFPMIAYSENVGKDLYFLHCNDVACAGGDDVPAMLADEIINVGSIDMRLDSNSNAVITYQGGGVKIVHCSDALCATFSSQTIDSANALGIKLQLDSNNFPIIAYKDTSGSPFKLVHCNDINCNASVNGAESVENLNIPTSFIDMTLSSTDLPIISYSGSSRTNVLFCSSTDCPAGATLTSFISGFIGFESAIVLDDSDFPVVIGFSSPGVRVHHCNDGFCLNDNETNSDLKEIKLDVGQYGDLMKIGNEFLFSYYDRSDTDLRFRRCEDATCSGFLSPIQTIVASANDDVGRFSQLALPSNDLPLVIYYNTTGALRIAACANPDCSGSASTFPIDATNDVGQYASMQLDTSDLPIVSYYDATNGDLKVAHCVANSCASFSNSVLTVDTGAGNDVGQYTSLVTDASSFPVVSYFDATAGALKLLHCNDANCDSSVNGAESIVTVDSGMGNTVGLYTSLRLDLAGFPVMSYYDSTAGSLKLVHCGDANCSVNNSIATADSGDTHDVGQYSSLTLDASGLPIISYYDASNKDILIIHCADENCTAVNNAKAVALTTDDVGTDSVMVVEGSTAYISFYNATSRQRQMVDVPVPVITPLNPFIFADGFESL